MAEHRWSTGFLDWYLIPLGSAIWSADPETFTQIPARTFVEFFSRHGLLGPGDQPAWRTVTGGSTRYVEAILEPLRRRGRLHLCTPVTKLRRHERDVELLTAAGPVAFDHVVVATHSDQALALLGDPTDRERRVLGALRYQPNRATLHTDTALLPTNRRAWASWNYVRPAGPTDRATLTYYLNRLQGLEAEQPVLVTLNRDEAIDPSQVVATVRLRASRHRPGGGGGPGQPTRAERRAPSPTAGPTGGTGSTRTGSAARWPSASGSGRACERPGPATRLRSALYEGTVTHRRAEPAHRFDSPVALPLLFLDELAELRAAHPLVDFDPSPHRRRWPAAIRLRRDDYLPSDAITVRGAVEDAVAAAGGSVRGPVAMLGHVRTWGWLFNPVTLYYCFDPSGRDVEWTVLEVSNTPWHERCSYVVGPPGEHRFAKAMHVSPFLPAQGDVHPALLRAG